MESHSSRRDRIASLASNFFRYLVASTATSAKLSRVQSGVGMCSLEIPQLCTSILQPEKLNATIQIKPESLPSKHPRQSRSHRRLTSLQQDYDSDSLQFFFKERPTTLSVRGWQKLMSEISEAQLRRDITAEIKANEKVKKHLRTSGGSFIEARLT